VYAASFSSVRDAETALDAIEHLYKDGAVGTLDAAVIDKENGKPHIVKRLDRPRIRIIPELFGGGALPRKQLQEASEQLTADQAGLLVVSGEPLAEKVLDKALAGAAKVAKHGVDAHDRPDQQRAAGSAQTLTTRACVPAPDSAAIRPRPGCCWLAS
jgi:hypothetical protein